MFSKLLSFVVFLIAVLFTQWPSTYAQQGWYPVLEDYAEQEQEIVCDRPVCVAPCPGAAPPPYCPVNITRCSSGCACMLQCRRPVYVCFMIKFCITRRRYLTRTTTPMQLVNYT